MKRNGVAARVGAIILAASLVAADAVPASAAMLNPDDALVSDVMESVLDTETEETVEEDAETEAAEESSEIQEVAAEENSEMPEEAAVEVIGETAVESGDVESTGTAGTPAKVTGLKVSGNYLTWDSQEMTAYGYDVMATSPAGVKYYSFDGIDANGDWAYGYDSATSHDFRNDKDEQYFNLQTERLHTSVSEAANYMTPGTVYQYQVRAVNRVSVKDALGNMTYNYTYGQWSNAVSFTLPVYAKLTNVTVNTEQSDDSYLYLNLGQAVEWYSLHATIYSDAACTNSVARKTYLSKVNSACTKTQISYSNLTPGQTYYVRLYNSVSSYWDDSELALAGDVTYSNVVAFRVPGVVASVQETAPATTLSIAGTEKDSVKLKASSVEVMKNYQNSWYVKYEYSTNGQDWSELGQISSSAADYDYTVSYWRLAQTARTPNTPVYIRAQAYVYGYDEYDDWGPIPGTVSNVLTLNSPAISKISNLKYEQGETGFSLRYSGTVDNSYEKVIYEYSTNKNFTKNFSKDEKNKNTKITTNSTISYEDLIPGQTYYVRAYVDSEYYSDADTIHGKQYSAYTNILTLKAAVPDISTWASVTSNSVKLSMNLVTGSNGPVTGYQIARKSGKSYTELARVTDDVYTDAKLTSDTKYTYRVRAYYYDSAAKKMYYGIWAYVDATTWGNSLDLKATAASATSVKLSWNKVTGANGYEVYRYVGSGGSKYYDSEAGVFSKKQLVKNIKKASTKSYTDKGLTAGEDYSYVVRAYRVKDGKTYYIDDYAEASLAFGSVVVEKQTQNTKNGKTTVTWKRNPAAKGYLIEKYDTETNEWKTTKQIKKNSTVKYTFPAVTGTDTSAKYRIRAYSGKKYSSATTITIERKIAVAGSVKAKASAKNGAITISWKKVNGADYYKVYRTTSSESKLSEKTNTISHITGEKALDAYMPDEDAYSGYTAQSYVTTTSFVDQKISYTNKYGEEVVLEEGPQAGVKYYYYVKAYKVVDGDYNAVQAAKDEESLTSFTVVSSYGYSKAASATVTSAKVGKAAVKSVKSSKKKQVTVTIKKKISGAVGYQIYRSTNKSKGYTLVGTTTKLSYTDKTVKSGKKYYYKVKVISYNEAGVDIYSALSSASKVVKAK